MMTNRNLDMDVLRSVVALDEHGTLAQAGERVGRTQAALPLDASGGLRLQNDY